MNVCNTLVECPDCGYTFDKAKIEHCPECEKKEYFDKLANGEIEFN